MAKKKKVKPVKDEIKVLISYNGRLFPFSLNNVASKKFVKKSNESASCGGGIGEFFFMILEEAEKAVKDAKASCTGDDTKDDTFKWGFKIKSVREEDGHELYEVKDDPLP